MFYSIFKWLIASLMCIIIHQTASIQEPIYYLDSSEIEASTESMSQVDYIYDDVLMKTVSLDVIENFSNISSNVSDFTSIDNHSVANGSMHLSLAQDSTTTIPLNYYLIKYGLIGLVIGIPLVLLPVLFLFIRASNTEANNNADNDEQDFVQDDMQPCIHSISLFSTCNPENDSYLMDKNCWGTEVDGSNAVVVDKQTKAPFYMLDPAVTMIRPRTGQLYHSSSGLLFNPIQQCIFDSVSGQVVDLKLQQQLPPNPNLVYNSSNNAVYERCLAFAFRNSLRPGEENKLNLHLARSPQKSSHQQMVPRRARPAEFPRKFGDIYGQLLAKQSHNPIHEPIPSALQVVQSTSKFQQEAPPKLANPLLLIKRDYSKLSSLDMKPTPRKSLQSNMTLSLKDATMDKVSLVL